MHYNLNNHRWQVPSKKSVGGISPKEETYNIVLWRNKGETRIGGLRREGNGREVKEKMWEGTANTEGLLKGPT